MINIVEEVEKNGKLEIVVSARSRRTAISEEAQRESHMHARSLGYDPKRDVIVKYEQAGPFDYRACFFYSQRLIAEKPEKVKSAR